jgi:hypothetical protein
MRQLWAEYAIATAEIFKKVIESFASQGAACKNTGGSRTNKPLPIWTSISLQADVNVHHGSSRLPMKKVRRSLPSADFALCSISANSSESTPTGKGSYRGSRRVHASRHASGDEQPSLGR